jgi:uracil-DNA glycosylase
MLIGMAPGFFNDSKHDKISHPYKPSFYFANTSKILRTGFLKNLNKIYFTNLSKITTSKEIMDSTFYQNQYELFFEILKKEIEIIKPSLIYSVGTTVHKFLLQKQIKTNLLYHPSYFLFKNQTKQAIEYYNKQCNKHI